MPNKKRKTRKQKEKSQKRAQKQGYKVRKQKKIQRELLIINNKPIRRKAIVKCTHILNNYYTIKKELDHFEEKERPLFTQWLNANFGAKLTEIREIHKEIDELEDFVNLVHFIKYSKGISFHQAYSLVQELKKNPEGLEEELAKIHKKNSWYDPFETDEDDDLEDYEEDLRDDYDEDMEDYEEDLRDDYDEDMEENEEFTEEDLEMLFVQFLEEIPEYEDILNDPRLYMKFFEEFKNFFANDENEKKNNTLFDNDINDTRLKTLYRSLAFKLHPDNSNLHNTETLELWYKVQEAYRRKDIDELEKLNALQSFQQGNFSPDCPVSHILAVHSEYKEQLKIVRKSVRQCKKDIAWDFSKRDDKADIYTCISNDIAETIKTGHLRKSYFNNLISKWTESQGPQNQYTSRYRRKKKFVPPPEQMELPF